MQSIPVLMPLAALAVAVALASPAAAQDVLGTFGAWTAFSEKSGGKLTCYVGSKPKKMDGKYTSRDPAYLLVTHRPAEKVKGEVSFQAGYTFKPGSEPVVSIGSRTFKLFTKESNAWATDAAADKQLVQAMKGGSDLVFKGTSSRGTAITDTYALTGFTAAMAAIDQACGA
ncbi:MAG: invasion associated locus B family protein [Rhodospirillales bacterium]